jgi:hypothetical protein
MSPRRSSKFQTAKKQARRASTISRRDAPEAVHEICPSDNRAANIKAE